MYEVLRDGVPLSRLFFSPVFAQEWIEQQKDGATYEIREFATKEN